MRKEERITLYPMKFRPRFIEKPWGGFRFRDELGYEGVPDNPCGEAWLLSAVPGLETVVDNGPLQGNTLSEVYEVFMEELTGEALYEKHPEQFPLLVKLLDANEWLSLQVHPNDQLADKRYNSTGKTEMWYILDAEQGATLMSGFNREMDRNTMVFVTENGALPDVMHAEPVAKGDLFYTPAGRVHAIGPGIMLAEIQQTSDVTYRLWDWGRVDQDGKPRETHLHKALDAIDFQLNDHPKRAYQQTVNAANEMIRCDHFFVNIIPFNTPMKNDYSHLDTCVALLCTKGAGALISEPWFIPFRAGEVILVPQNTSSVELIAEQPAEVLEIYVPV